MTKTCKICAKKYKTMRGILVCPKCMRVEMGKLMAVGLDSLKRETKQSDKIIDWNMGYDCWACRYNHPHDHSFRYCSGRYYDDYD